MRCLYEGGRQALLLHRERKSGTTRRNIRIIFCL